MQIMSHQKFVWLVLAIALGASGVRAEEPLHPAFADDSRRDPFLTPAKAQVSGPLSGGPADDVWDAQQLPSPIAPSREPVDVFAEYDGEDCADTAGTAAMRRRFVMDTGATVTWLAPVDDFGVTDIETRTSLIIPVFIKGSPLRLSLNLGTTFFDAPAALDVPEQVYGLQADLNWFIPLRETWSLAVGLGGGVYSDLSSGRGFRVTGRAIVFKEYSKQLKLSAGVMILGRENLPAVPVAGLTYLPTEDWKIEVLIPRPRVARRVKWDGSREHWVYGGIELFGGNSWAIEQPGGVEDTLIYKDNRLIVGYETKAPGSFGGRVELGYVFTRQLEFEKSPAELEPGGTILLRAGVSY